MSSMAMGKRRRRGRQQSMWVATADLPQSAGHPFYERLNRDRFLCTGVVDGDGPKSLTRSWLSGRGQPFAQISDLARIRTCPIFPTHPQHSISILPSVTRTGYDVTLSGAGGPWT